MTKNNSVIPMQLDYSNSNKLMHILRNSIYSDPLLAVAREYISNAIDAHVNAGLTTAVFAHISTSIPDTLSPFFLSSVESDYHSDSSYLQVIDNGFSMNKSQIENVYSKMGYSSKENEIETIGAFGLGSKCGLSYKSFFFIETYTKEEHGYYYRIWKQYINDREEGCISLLKEEKQNLNEQRTGTTITIAIDDKDSSKLISYISLLKYINTFPIDCNYIDYFYCPRYNVVSSSWRCNLRTNYSNDSCIAVVKGIPIKVSYANIKNIISNVNSFNLSCSVPSHLQHLKDVSKFVHFCNYCLYNHSFLLVLDADKVDIAVSREELQFSTKTCSHLINCIYKMYIELCTYLYNEVVFTSDPFELFNLRAENSMGPETVNSNIFDTVLCKNSLEGLYNVVLKEKVSDLVFNYPISFYNKEATEFHDLEMIQYKVVEKTVYQRGNRINTLNLARSKFINCNASERCINNCIFYILNSKFKSLKELTFYCKNKGLAGKIIRCFTEEQFKHVKPWLKQVIPSISQQEVREYYIQNTLQDEKEVKQKSAPEFIKGLVYAGIEIRPRATGFLRYFKETVICKNQSDAKYYLLETDGHNLDENCFNLSLRKYLQLKGINRDDVITIKKVTSTYKSSKWIDLGKMIQQEIEKASSIIPVLYKCIALLTTIEMKQHDWEGDWENLDFLKDLQIQNKKSIFEKLYDVKMKCQSFIKHHEEVYLLLSLQHSTLYKSFYYTSLRERGQFFEYYRTDSVRSKMVPTLFIYKIDDLFSKISDGYKIIDCDFYNSSNREVVTEYINMKNTVSPLFNQELVASLVDIYRTIFDLTEVQKN